MMVGSHKIRLDKLTSLCVSCGLPAVDQWRCQGELSPLADLKLDVINAALPCSVLLFFIFSFVIGML